MPMTKRTSSTPSHSATSQNFGSNVRTRTVVDSSSFRIRALHVRHSPLRNACRVCQCIVCARVCVDMWVCATGPGNVVVHTACSGIEVTHDSRSGGDFTNLWLGKVRGPWKTLWKKQGSESNGQDADEKGPWTKRKRIWLNPINKVE